MTCTDGFRLISGAEVASGMGLPESIARPTIVEPIPDLADWPITRAQWDALLRYYSPPCVNQSLAGRRRP